MIGKELISVIEYGRNSGRFRLWLGNIAKEIINREKITIATTDEERAEMIVKELSYYGLNLNFKHLYKDGKYDSTLVFVIADNNKL